MAMRLAELRNVTYDAKPLWQCLAGIGFAWCAAGVPTDDPRARVLYAGFWLQVIGLAFVAIGFGKRQRIFGVPLMRTRVGSWFRRLTYVVVGRRGVRGDLNVMLGEGAITATGTLTAVHSAGPDTPLDRRVAILEQRVERLDADFKIQISEVRTNVTTLGQRFDKENAARTTQHAELASTVKQLAVGDLDYEVVGLVWLVLSTVATSIPGDVVWFWQLFQSR